MNLLGYKCAIIDKTIQYSKWIIELDYDTVDNRLKIAKRCKIPTSMNCVMFWQRLLQHLHFKYYLNAYHGWSADLPVFISRYEAERFILLVNSEFLIDIL